MQFVVDTVHGFQGDERDVIFFSPVVSAGVGESTLRFLKSHGNLFNVAVTRARSELVVVGDRQAALDSGVGYLASFAEYSRELAPRARPGAAAARDAGPEYPPVAHPELVSDWERVFYRALYAADLRPVPQYEEAPYTLDFALFRRRAQAGHRGGWRELPSQLGRRAVPPRPDPLPPPERPGLGHPALLGLRDPRQSGRLRASA